MDASDDDSVLLSIRELLLIQQERELEEARRAYEAEQSRVRLAEDERAARAKVEADRVRALAEADLEVQRRHAEARRHAEEARVASARRVREECERADAARRAETLRAHDARIRHIDELGRRVRRSGIFRVAVGPVLAALCALGGVAGALGYTAQEDRARLEALDREVRVAERSARDARERLQATERRLAALNATASRAQASTDRVGRSSRFTHRRGERTPALAQVATREADVSLTGRDLDL